MKTSKRYQWLYVFVIIVLFGSYIYWALSKPLPLLQPTHSPIRLQTQTATPKLVWPVSGQSAVGIVDSSILETHGAQTPVPTASTAKLITALTVLRARPLAIGEQGPTITLGSTDVALYNSYASQGGSVVQVAAGEQITEYQMLEAMLLPSANNMADSLAIWAFGSLSTYSTTANSYLKQLGLTRTHVGTDASGFAPSTTSTAGDLVRLGERVMQNPVLAQIVGQTTSSGIPVVNSVKNVNFLLGTDNIVGIKTGNTDQAGGVFISASHTIVNDKPVTIVTALAKTPTLFEAVQDSLPLIQSAQANFDPVAVITGGNVVGSYRQPWNSNLSAVASKGLTLSGWNGNPIPLTARLQPIPATTSVGQVTGTVTVAKSAFTDQESVPVKLQTPPTKPTIWWRLLHP